MAELDVLQVEQVARRLAAPTERWGWQFHEPAAVRPYPDPRPRYSEPGQPYLPTMADGYLRARAQLTKRIVITSAMMLIGICGRGYGVIVCLAAIGLAAYWFVPMYQARQKAAELLA